MTPQEYGKVLALGEPAIADSVVEAAARIIAAPSPEDVAA